MPFRLHVAAAAAVSLLAPILASPLAARSDDTGAAAAAALLAPPPEMTGSLPPKDELPAVTLGKSGLPVPRFVSLKAGKVNVRVGPGERYAIAWTFTRSALPVEVIQEYDTWRRVRDSDGSVGWVLQNLLSSKRTAVVAPWALGEPKPIRATPAPKATVSAYLEAGVLADVSACHLRWCRLSGAGFSGWIEQEQLWGVYPGEEIP